MVQKSEECTVFEELKGYHKPGHWRGLGGSKWVCRRLSKHGYTQAHVLDVMRMSGKEEPDPASPQSHRTGH